MDTMVITSAQYVASVTDSNDNTSIKATIDGVEMSVPNNATGNRHYDEIMRQVEAGELTIQDAE